MITWITGNSGSGKSTLARKLIKDNTILLDGDNLRGVWTDLGLNMHDRIEHNLRVARLAKTLDAQGFNIVVAVICPYKILREEITKICHPKWIYLPGGENPSETYPYEEGGWG